MIDLKKFKKIASDAKKTILMHENGHKIEIAHKGLSDSHRVELEEMPVHKGLGGKLEPKSERHDRIPGRGVGPVPSNVSQKAQPSKPQGETAYTEPKDMGTKQPVFNAISYAQHEAMQEGFGGFKTKPGDDIYPPCINPACKSYGRSHPNCRCYGGNEYANQRFAEGGQVEGYCSSGKKPHQQGCEYFVDGGEAGADPAPGTQAEVPSQDQPDQQVAPEQDAQEPNRIPAAQDSPAPAMPPDQPASPQDQMAQHKADVENDLAGETQAFKSDVDAGHIKPETYHDLFAKKDTLGKIGTIFGLLAGGMGSGLTHQPNALLGMMDNQIKNDLQAQQDSVTNKQNFLKVNQMNELNRAQVAQHNVETQSKAWALSLNQMRYASLDNMTKMIQTMPPGPKRQQYENALAQMSNGITLENASVNSNMAAKAAYWRMLNGGAGGGAGMPNTTMLKSGLLGPEAKEVGGDIEEKSIPGIPGKASRPLDNNDRSEITSGMGFDKQLQNFVNWTKTHSGDLNPADRKYGQALAAQVQGAYRQATHGGVYKEGEQNFISKIITDNPTAFFNKIRAVPQLQAVQDDLHTRLDQSLKNKGFSGYPGNTQSKRSSAPSAPQTQTSKSGRNMIQKNGKWYYQ